MRILPALAIVLASTTTAQAARLTTPPVYGITQLRCEVAYFGSGVNVPVTIRAMNPRGIILTATRKLGPSNRIAGIWQDCSGALGEDGLPDCEPVACSFTFNVPVADMNASATIWNVDGTLQTIPSR